MAQESMGRVNGMYCPLCSVWVRPLLGWTVRGTCCKLDHITVLGEENGKPHWQGRGLCRLRVTVKYLKFVHEKTDSVLHVPWTNLELMSRSYGDFCLSMEGVSNHLAFYESKVLVGNVRNRQNHHIVGRHTWGLQVVCGSPLLQVGSMHASGKPLWKSFPAF